MIIFLLLILRNLKGLLNFFHLIREILITFNCIETTNLFNEDIHSIRILNHLFFKLSDFLAIPHSLLFLTCLFRIQSFSLFQFNFLFQVIYFSLVVVYLTLNVFICLIVFQIDFFHFNFFLLLGRYFRFRLSKKLTKHRL